MANIRNIFHRIRSLFECNTWGSSLVSIFDENFVAVQMDPLEVRIDKPITVGETILDLSKFLMYKFHYKYIKKWVGDNNCCLLYTDTGSFIYEIKNVNIYDVLKRNSGWFDTAEYPASNKFRLATISGRELGIMKDECKGRILMKFVGLRSKLFYTS